MRVDFIKFVYNKFLNSLEDVELTAPSDGDILILEDNKFINKNSGNISLYGSLDSDVLVQENKAVIMVNPVINDNEIMIEGELVIL